MTTLEGSGCVVAMETLWLTLLLLMGDGTGDVRGETAGEVLLIDKGAVAGYVKLGELALGAFVVCLSSHGRTIVGRCFGGADMTVVVSGLMTSGSGEAGEEMMKNG